MDARTRYTAARLPNLPGRDALTNRTAQLHMEHRRLASLLDRYKDDEDLSLPHCGSARHRENQRHVDLGFANPDRGFYPPSRPQYNDLDSLEPGRHRPYHGRHLSDSVDEESDFDRHRLRLHRGPPRYDTADDWSVFDDGRHGSFRGWPSPASDMETRDFDREIFRAVDPGLRFSHPPLGSLRSRDIELDRLEDLQTRLRRSAYPISYPTYDGFGPDPSMGSRDLGRVGTHATGRFHSEYHYDGDFEEDDLDENFRDIPSTSRPPRAGHCSDLDFRFFDDDSEDKPSQELRDIPSTSRPPRAGHCSDLDFRFFDDDSEDKPSQELRAPGVTGRRHRLSPAQIHDGIDAEEIDADDWERERQEAPIGKRYTDEDPGIDEIANVHLQDRRGRVPRVARPRPTAKLSDDNLEESPRGRRGRPFRPHQAANRQTSRRSRRTKVKSDSPAGRTDTQQAPPSYDSVTPAQVTARVQSQQSGNPHHTPVAPALPNNTPSRPQPTAAVIADKIFETTAKEILHSQQQFLDSISQAKTGTIPRDSAAGVETDNDRSDSSDSGCDTPDEESETSRAGTENSDGGDGLQTFIHITL